MAALTGHSVQRGVCAICGPITTRRCQVGERLRAKAYRERMTPEEAVRYRRSNALKHKFGLTIERYDELLARQDGVCAVCREAPGYRGLDVDHDHSCCPGRRSCGRCIRGLLCSPCNRAIGYFRDDPVLMRAAIEYLATCAFAREIEEAMMRPIPTDSAPTDRLDIVRDLRDAGRLP